MYTNELTYIDTNKASISQLKLDLKHQQLVNDDKRLRSMIGWV